MIESALMLGTMLAGLGLSVFAFSSGGPKRPPPTPPQPSKSDAEIQSEAAKERQLARNRRGRQSTILAGEGDFLRPAETTGKTRLGD